MSDYIKREDALKAVDAFIGTDPIADRIKLIPSADVAPVRHGRWLNCKWVESGFKFVCCSECKYDDFDSRLYKYCPNCGARMDAKE